MSIELQKIDHLIEQQFAAEEAMRAECANGGFTLEKPYVKLNPYIIAPLTALVHFRTPEPTEAKVVVKGKEAAGDMGGSFPKATEHWLPVLGLYPDYENTVEITAGGKTVAITIKTDKPTERLQKVESIDTTAAYMGDNVVVISPTTAAYVAAYDYRGDARWYLLPNFAFDFKRIRNGRILMGTHRLLMPPYHTSGLFEFGMIGKIYNEFRLPGGYHHDQFEMEDGNILVLTQKPERGTVEDMCVLLDRKSGKIVKEWDYQKILPQNVGGSGSQDEHDWFHNNAVWYDKKTHTLTLSGRHQDAVINIDYDSGKLNWIIGDPEGWPEDMQKKYFFKPVGDLSKFDWQYEQHACVVLPDGDVMCFDNGHWRAKVKEKYVEAKDNFSRGVRYRLNTDKMEIEQVWQYGKERGAEFFSTYICNVEYYGEGWYMVHSGGTGFYKGEACNRPPVQFRGEMEKDLVTRSITVELKDDRVVYEMKIPGNFYRAEKLPLYCAADALTFGKGQILGSLGRTPTFDTIPDVPEGGMVPDRYKLKLAQECDRLVLKGTFEKGQLVMLLLEGLEGQETKAYFVPTTKRPFLAMCVGTFLEADERAVEFPVSFEGIAPGKYKVRFVIDEAKYDTGATLEI